LGNVNETVQVVCGISEDGLELTDVDLDIGIEHSEAGSAEEVFSLRVHRRGDEPVGGGLEAQSGKEEGITMHIDFHVVGARGGCGCHAW
jgi:hypothetical protein